MSDPYKVVRDFEAAIAEYTGARHVVCVSSCSAAIMLALRYVKPHIFQWPYVQVPRRTYASVPMAALHAGMNVEWIDLEWTGEYAFYHHSFPRMVWDSARRFRRAMFRGNCFQCVSFQTSKILGLEQGGAILHDNDEADTWFRRARFDGRLDHTEKLPKQLGWHVYLNPSTAAQGIAKLACLPDNPPDNGGSYLFEDLSKLDIWR